MSEVYQGEAVEKRGKDRTGFRPPRAPSVADRIPSADCQSNASSFERK